MCQPVEWSPASLWRPFCSERCKTLDLGAWASEAYRIPVDESADDESPRVPGRAGRRHVVAAQAVPGARKTWRVTGFDWSTDGSAGDSASV